MQLGRGVEMDESLVVDRISALPDDVLHRILGGVGCVRAAARTSILSGQWRGLWTGLETVTVRDLAPDAIRAALARLARPVVAALDIEVSVPPRGLRAADVDSLLAAAAGPSPSKLDLTFPGLSLDGDVAIPLPRLDAVESLGLAVRGVVFVSPPGLDRSSSRSWRRCPSRPAPWTSPPWSRAAPSCAFSG